MSLAGLMAGLRRDAPRVDRGRFRIDAERALQKLQDFRLPEPEMYVLELLRAAIASGARTVEVRADADDFELAFDGRSFPEAMLRELPSHALGAGEGPDAARFQLLALGVVGALALRPRFIDVQSGSFAVRVVPPHRIEPRAASPRPLATRIHVRERLGLRVARDLVRGSREVQLIRERAVLFPASLTVAGEVLPPPELPAATLVARHHDRGPRRFAVGIVPRLRGSRPSPSQLGLACYGVLIRARPFPLAALPLHGHANDDRLRRNASGSDTVVDDPIFLDLMNELARAAGGMVEDLVALLANGDRAQADAAREVLVELAAALLTAPGKPGPDGAEPLLRSAIETAIAASEAEQAEPSKGLRATLARAPLLPGPAGEWVSIAELRAQRDAGKPVRTSRVALHPGDYAPPVVLLEGLDETRMALLPADDWQDVAEEVAARRRREANRAAWQAQPVEEPRLPAALYIARASIGTDDIAGEVGFEPGASTSLVRFLLNGRPLRQRVVAELHPLRLVAVVDDPRLQPDQAYLDVAEDDAYLRLLLAIQGAAVAALTQAVAASPVPPPDLSAHARDLIAMLPRADLPEVISRAPLYELAGGDRTSLADIESRPRLAETDRPWPWPPFDGEPVVVVDRRHLDALRAQHPELEIVSRAEDLWRELSVRGRLAAPPAEPVLGGRYLVEVPVEGPGVRGQLGLREAPATSGTLRLLRQGIAIETVMLETLAPGAEAVVEAPSLRPTTGWTAVERDDAYAAAVAAAVGAQRVAAVKLLDLHPLATIDALPEPAQDLLREVLRRELVGAPGGELDAIGWRLRQHTLLAGPTGTVSIARLVDEARRAGALWVTERALDTPPPDGMFVVRAPPELASLLSAITGVPPSDAGWEILRRERLRRFLAQPLVEPVLPSEVALRVAIDEPGLHGEVGVDTDGPVDPRATILHQGRSLLDIPFEARLPLLAILEVDDPTVNGADRRLPPPLLVSIHAVLSSAERRLVDAALRQPRSAEGRAVLLLAIAIGLDGTYPEIARQPLFPTTAGGVPATLEELVKRKRVAFVTAEVVGELPTDQPPIVASEPSIQRAMRRFGWRQVDMTRHMLARVAAGRTRARQAAPQSVAVTGRALRRRAFATDDVHGEVALGPTLPPTLRILRDGKLVCQEPLDVPHGIAAAVDSPALTPFVDWSAVKHDAPYRRVRSRVRAAVEALARELAEQHAQIPDQERAAIDPLLARLAEWLLRRRRTRHAAIAAPVFVATDGRPISLADMIATNRLLGHVPFALINGKLLDDQRWVWRPRPGEQEPIGNHVTLLDYSAQLAHDQKVRAAPEVRNLAVVVESAWREPIAVAATVGVPAMDGEVALTRRPTAALRIEVLCRRRHVLVDDGRHPVGGHARVSLDMAGASDLFTDPIRRRLLEAIRERVEVALDRLLERLFSKGSEAEWRPYLRPALKHALRAEGPLRTAVTGVAPFRDPLGRPVTLGAVLAESSGRGSVAIVPVGITASREDLGRLVLAVTPEDRDLLEAIGIASDDLSGQAARALHDASRAPAGVAPRDPGSVLARLPVASGGWQGELALSHPPTDEGIALVRDGRTVGRHRLPPLLLAGTLKHTGAPMTGSGGTADLDAEQQAFVRRQVECLFERLAEGPVAPEMRASAARHVLSFLRWQGVTSAEQLDRLTGPAPALCRMKLFATVDGSTVDLVSIASHACRSGTLAVAVDVGVDVAAPFALLGAADGLVSVLAEIVGEGRLVRLVGARAWEGYLAERDPAPEEPLHQGLATLRREAELLHADSAGRLGARELGGIRLRRGTGRAPVAYDATSALVFLDPNHPGVWRALTEHALRPDLIYVLIASIYGAINRAFDHVTDEDEARLATTLLDHLLANRHRLAAIR